MPIVYVTETTDAALLERAQDTRPHGYVLRQADPRQLDLTLRGALGAASRNRNGVRAAWNSAVLQGLFDRLSDAVIVADVRGKFVAMNAAARAIGPYDPAHPEASSERYAIYRADGETPFALRDLPLTSAIRGESTDGTLLRLRPLQHETGSEDIWLIASGYPLRDASGRCIGGAVVLRNVTSSSQEAARAGRIEAELHERVLQAFAHGRLEVIDTLQHNIGNAINSVATGVDTLHEWLEDNELVRRFDALAGLVREHESDWIDWLAHDDQGRRIRPFLLALISDLTREQRSLRKTTDRVRERVRHIVDIIRAQAAFTNGAVERKTIDLAQTLADAVTVVQEGLGRRGVDIEVDCSRAPGELLVQEGRFQQLLVNLLVNALEATDERAARLGTDGWRPPVRLSAYRSSEEGMLTIDVIDNGIGLEASQLPSVFTAGYTTKKDGTGLGLHSAANFVVGSGGSIRPLSDGIGAGTTMRVSLRLAAPGPATPKSDRGDERTRP